MQQELSDIIEIAAAIGVLGVGPVTGVLLAPFFSALVSYGDSKSRYSRMDSARQQALGKPNYVGFVRDHFRSIPDFFGIGDSHHEQSMKYFSAYLESEKERENNKFIGYRKIRK